jgi:flavin reductase (DIM6/NTAB) family NADH-FMN oxidoreductase RutF
LVSFSPAKTSSSWPRIEAAGRFCANVLTADQEDISQTFARSGADKFAAVGWSPSANGAPRLDHVLAWVDATIEDVVDAGDHLIVVGRVSDLAAARSGHPLLFFRGRYGRLALDLLDE